MPEYVCQCCDFKTHIKTKYTAHLETNKHLKCIEEKHNEKPVEKPVESSKTDEITELRQMIMKMSETIETMKQQIHDLTVRVNTPVEVATVYKAEPIVDKTESLTVYKAEEPTVDKAEPVSQIVRRIKIKPSSDSEHEIKPKPKHKHDSDSESEVESERKKTKRMTVNEELAYLKGVIERLGDDAPHFLIDYKPKQKEPKPHEESDYHHPWKVIDRFVYATLTKMMSDGWY